MAAVETGSSRKPVTLRSSAPGCEKYWSKCVRIRRWGGASLMSRSLYDFHRLSPSALDGTAPSRCRDDATSNGLRTQTTTLRAGSSLNQKGRVKLLRGSFHPH